MSKQQSNKKTGLAERITELEGRHVEGALQRPGFLNDLGILPLTYTVGLLYMYFLPRGFLSLIE
jgi:hypothetical protein